MRARDRSPVFRAAAASAGVLLAASASGCWGLECDPRAMMAQLAGPTSIDCGDIDGWDSDAKSGDVAHACARRASAKGQPFHASAQPASNDGGEIIGWA